MVSCSRILRPCRKKRKTKSNKIEAIEADDAHDECRLCLEPAIFRLCCGTWYCNQCYYKTGECPSCGDSVEGKARTGQHKDKLGRLVEDLSSNKFQVYGAILVKLVIWFNIIWWPLTYFISQVGNYDTLHGYKCAGYFPNCQYELCINMLGILENKSLYTDPQKECSSSKRCRRLCSKACVIDERLYAKTRGKMGLDICRPQFNKKVIVLYDNFECTPDITKNKLHQAPLEKSEDLVADINTGECKYFVAYPQNESDYKSLSPAFLDHKSRYNSDFNAEYVRGFWPHFDKNPDPPDPSIQPAYDPSIPQNDINGDWVFRGGNPSYRKSALWEEVRNGNPLSICGSSRGKNSLVFAGQKFRDATSHPLNLEYGGSISFSIKFGGFTYEDGTYHDEFCRPAFTGDMYILYSIDNKQSWQELAQFAAQVYKKAYHFNETVDIPPDAWSLKTYIRFEQRDFKMSDDFVAIDNVTIQANAVPEDWESSDNWILAKTKATNNDKKAQCCFNSRKCERGYGAMKNENPSLKECGQFAGYYNFAEELPMATTGESFVLLWSICLLLGFVKRSYQSNGKLIMRLRTYFKLHTPPEKVSRMPSAKEMYERSKDKYRYLIEPAGKQKDTEIITFCPDVDPKWQMFFFLVVPVFGSFLSAVAVLRGWGRGTVRIDTATSLTENVKSVMPLTYFEYFFDINFSADDLSLAVMLILVELPMCWYTSIEHVGNFFTRAPTFQVIHRTDDLPKNELIVMDRLLINGNEEYPIVMDSIMGTEEATILWTKLAAAGLVLSSFPFGLLLFCASEYLPSGITLLLALYSTLKIYAGPNFLAHALLYYPWFVEIRQDNIDDFANGCCSQRCMYVGGVVGAVALPVSLAVLFVMMTLDDLNYFNLKEPSIPPMLFWLFPFSMVMAGFMFGGVIGWGRRFQMHGHFYMCAVKEPLLVTFKNKQNYRSHENHPKAAVLHQNTVLCCPVLDNYAMGEAVRCELLEYERNIIEEFGKGYRAQIKLDLDYGTVLQSYEDFCKNVLLDLSRNIPCPLYGLQIENVVEGSTIVNFLVLDSDGVKEMDFFDKATQLKIRMVDDKSEYKADLEFKAEALIRTQKMQWANLEHFYGYPIQAIGRLATSKKALRLRGTEIVESEDEDFGEDEEDGELSPGSKKKKKKEEIVGSAAIIISGQISSEEEPSDDSLADDEEWGYGLKGQPDERTLSPFSEDEERNANMLLDQETPEVKTMFKSYKGSHGKVNTLLQYPEHIREMMASIQLSTSPMRQKQCRRPYCRLPFTDDTNRGDVCSYHPGIRIHRVRPCVEGEEPTPGFDGVNEELWTCCGQPYIDFHKVKMQGSLGLPCKKCPHWG